MAAPTPARRGRKPSASSATRAKVEQAALHSFAEIGYHATSMRSLAETASVGSASVYHWYPNKEALLTSIMRGFLDGLSREVVARIDEQFLPIDCLAAAVRSHVMYHGMHRRAAFVTDTEVRALTGENRDVILAIRDDYEQLFVQMIGDGVESGALECREPRVATRALLLACTGVALWFKPSGPLSLPDVAELHVDLVLNSLNAKRPSGR